MAGTPTTERAVRTAKAPGRRRAPLALAAIVTTTWAALVSYVPVVAAVALFAGRPQLSIGTGGWLLAHGVPLSTRAGRRAHQPGDRRAHPGPGGTGGRGGRRDLRRARCAGRRGDPGPGGTGPGRPHPGRLRGRVRRARRAVGEPAVAPGGPTAAAGAARRAPYRYRRGSSRAGRRSGRGRRRPGGVRWPGRRDPGQLPHRGGRTGRRDAALQIG